MINSTETLIADMKAAAEKCTSMSADIDENMAYANFIVKVEPSTFLALIAALEQLQQKNAKDFEIKSRLCDESNSLHDKLKVAENRIAELEASQLAVRLVEKISPSMAKEKAFWLGAVIDDDEADAFADGWNECIKAIRATGGTVQGDE